ncbi:unnamed protein product [Oncorhynchus mykiss]|uniref:Transmembrane protein 54 n=1 Tax=Oncorhynchus mykiss TaxID=8022 RepID=A0A060X511_ONCMY|nr:unnamed protein product [Oncorhynchus mykiss]
MGNLGVCCADLKDNKTLMKMGLGLVLVGHVNFLLGALVHGVVLRHINVHVQARVMGYAIYIIIALVAGLVGIIAGIVAIVLSKNLKNRILVNIASFSPTVVSFSTYHMTGQNTVLCLYLSELALVSGHVLVSSGSLSMCVGELNPYSKMSWVPCTFK